MIHRIKTVNAFSRRGFLGTAIGLGVLPWLAPERLAGALPLRSRRRLVVLYTPGEPIRRAHWRPQIAESVTSAKLSEVTLPEPINELDAYKQDIFMVGGKLKMSTANHLGVCTLLTGTKIIYPDGAEGASSARADGISLDQLLGERMGESPLVIGWGGRLHVLRGPSLMSYLGSGRPLRAITDPQKAFAEAFGGIANPSDGDVAAQKFLAQRRSILDQNAKQLITLRKRLAGEDGLNLEYHLDEVRRLENKLSDEGANLEACSGVEPGPMEVPGEKMSRMKPIRMQMDIMIEALRCGARNVGVLQCGDGGQMMGNPCYAPEYGVDLDLAEHDLQHTNATTDASPGDLAKRIQVERGYYRLFAAFLDKMKAATDVDGLPLLDNTVVFWCKALGYRHGCKEMFYMLAGGKNSGITKLGMYEDPGERFGNDILISLLHLMGQTDETFGDHTLVQGGIAV
ncbi:MAG: DUF1552 domain-containing protein [Nannocystaceae bacterium]